MRTSSAGRRRSGLAAIVLAAGGSTRLGRPKALLRFRQEALLARCCRLAARAVDGPVLVVLGAGRQRLRSLLARRSPRVGIAVNPRWPDGLAASLQTGLAQLPSGVDGALILLVDQAWLMPGDLKSLVARWRRRAGQPAAACYVGRHGAPAVIPRRFFAQLAGLRGDCGARQLLRELGSITSVSMPRAAFDVDTPADAARLSASTAGQIA